MAVASPVPDRTQVIDVLASVRRAQLAEIAETEKSPPKPALIAQNGQSPATPFSIKNLPRVSDLTVQMEWLVDDLIPLESVVMLSGESGSGKSTLALALASAVSHGGLFLGRASKQSHVLIIDKENGPRIYRERFNRLRIDENEYMHIWGPWCEPQPRGPDTTEVKNFAKEESPLIIFDSLVAFNEGSEQDADDIRDCMDRFRRLASLGATVLVIHHTGKGENTKEYRGSSDIKASVDVAYLLKSNNPTVLHSLELSCFKSREGVIEPLKIEVNEDNQFVSVQDSQREMVETVMRDHPRSNTQQVVRLSNGIPEKRVEQILNMGLAKRRYGRKKGPNNSWCWELV
jgi:predicted ATP-dependent serine protease